jgi:mono/diheme cytochrome c family protein
MKASTLNTLRAYLTIGVIGCSILTRLCAANQSGDPQNGNRLYDKAGCARCHGSSGEGVSQTQKESGPPRIASTRLSLEDFVRSVRAPKGQMPPFSAAQVSEAELTDIYAFLQSAASQPKIELSSSANPQNGQQLYTASGCYECHGLEGQGSTQTGGSRLGPPQIPFSSFVGYVRQPTAQMPPYTQKVISNAQLADIYVFLQSRPEAHSKNIPLLN